MAVEVSEDGQGTMNKERLAKLWNAYEIQEKEMTQMKGRMEDYENAIQEKDSMISTLKEAMSEGIMKLGTWKSSSASLTRSTADVCQRSRMPQKA